MSDIAMLRQLDFSAKGFDLRSGLLGPEYRVLTKVEKPPAQEAYEHDCHRPNQHHSTEFAGTVVENDDEPSYGSNRFDESSKYSLPYRQLWDDLGSHWRDQRSSRSERPAARFAENNSRLSGRTTVWAY